jgi:asparagine synthase (glutamine-hydrolysing)
MCGICGVLDLRPGARPDRDAFRRMRDAVTHRGPDDEGELVDGPGYLGFRRLSIVDLEGGHQPMFNEDGTVAVVFNGEIYNHADLRPELEARGHVFRTRADTEVIVHGWEVWGPSVVDRLRGMFAFAIYDLRNQRLFAARDRLGIKPLYFHHRPGFLAFGSEIKSLLEHPDVPRAVNRHVIPSYLTHRFTPGPDTLFDGIEHLPPGHHLTFDRKGLRIERWWDVDFRERFRGTYEDAAVRVRELVRESVRLRLMADVPLGALLSGGVDSSIVVANMASLMNRPVDTFSVGFRSEGGAPDAVSELRYARLVSRAFATRHHEIEIGEPEMLANVERMVWHQDEPVADPAALPTLLVSELARKTVKVVLTGEGGDELFAGYDKYATDRFARLYGLVPRTIRRLAVRPLGRRFQNADRSLGIRNEAERWASWFAGFDETEKRSLLSPELREEVGAGTDAFARHLVRTAGLEPLHRMLYVDTKMWLPDDLLMKVDRMSMAASIEARVPLLDHRLVEYAATLPPSFKVRGMQGKILLKEWARELLPNEVVDRRKVGFTVPLGRWFRGGLRPMLEDALVSERARSRGYFDPTEVRRLVDEHQSGRRDHGRALWTLVQLELWERSFFDGPRTARATA